MSVQSPLHARAAPFLAAGLLAPEDVYAVALSAPRFGETDPDRMLGLAFAVRAPRAGHAGVELCSLAERLGAEQGAAVRPGEPPPEPLAWPEPEAWERAVLASPMVGGPEDAFTPFVRQERSDGPLLLTRRLHAEQQAVARALVERAAREIPGAAGDARLAAVIAELFAGDAAGEAARAVRLAATRRLALVVGGPGTGKTYSVTRLLAALLLLEPGGTRFDVALAAPTGKAAARMREAIREAAAEGSGSRLPVTPEVRARLLALEAQTLHGLLGVRPDGSVAHGPGRPLPARLVIVDEVSMVDLAQMRRLLEAVHRDARLVLLGDRDQLPSVEAGSVLADLVPGRSPGRLAASTQTFSTSRRFQAAPDIGLLAACLQSYPTRHEDVPPGDDDAPRLTLAARVLVGELHATLETTPEGRRRITWLGPPHAPIRAGGAPGAPRPTDDQLEELARPYLEGFAPSDAGGARRAGYVAELLALREGEGYRAEARTPEARLRILSAFDRYRVLAVHRRGPLGVEGLERVLAERVRARLEGAGGAGRYHVGRALLVTENARELGLMNGDTGLVLPGESGPVAVFRGGEPGSVREIPLSRLPPHEGALAMTVHKAQGSQYERVALVLAGRASPIQTRELVYTGVTRAMSQLVWLGARAELEAALARRVARASGLGALLGAEGASGAE